MEQVTTQPPHWRLLIIAIPTVRGAQTSLVAVARAIASGIRPVAKQALQKLPDTLDSICETVGKIVHTDVILRIRKYLALPSLGPVGDFAACLGISTSINYAITIALGAWCYHTGDTRVLSFLIFVGAWHILSIFV